MKKAIVTCFGWVLGLCVCNALLGQTCTGNLGENIFTGGDFGSGTANIVLKDPMIAPGYRYTTSTPPFDGYYTITNNTAWPNQFLTWVGIKDNSTDPNGYMMVVNASFTPGIFYEQTITGLCENTLYEFSADVINLVRTITPNHILPNVSFLLDGVIKYNTGAIPQSEKWNKVGFTFTMPAGQDTLRLSLQNNAPGGNGNDLAIDNISFRACGPQALILPETVANICEDGNPINLQATILGSQYKTPALQWQRSLDGLTNWTNITGDSVAKHSNLAAGFYYYRYLIASSPQNLTNAKCRIVSNVKIIRVQAKTYTITDTICAGLTYKVGNTTYTQSGVYIDSLKSSLGCDSIVTLRLTVLPDLGIVADKIITPPGCIGISNGRVKIQAIRNAYAPFAVSLGPQPLPVVDSTFRNLGNGKYTLVITDHFGCVLRESIDINTPDPFVVEIGEDKTLNLGDAIILRSMSGTMIASSNYSFDQELICNDCEGRSWIPITSGIVRVRAASSSGCIAVDSIRITVKEVLKAYIPNVFTPNGDGLNDIFMIQGDASSVKAISSMQVFDRYGGLIFERKDALPNDITLGWDGLIRGKPADVGMYIYLARLVLINGKEYRKSGDILLIR